MTLYSLFFTSYFSNLGPSIGFLVGEVYRKNIHLCGIGRFAFLVFVIRNLFISMGCVIEMSLSFSGMSLAH